MTGVLIGRHFLGRAGVERESRCRPTKDRVAPLFEIALVLVRLDHVASVVVNADHSVM